MDYLWTYDGESPGGGGGDSRQSEDDVSTCV